MTWLIGFPEFTSGWKDESRSPITLSTIDGRQAELISQNQGLVAARTHPFQEGRRKKNDPDPFKILIFSFFIFSSLSFSSFSESWRVGFLLSEPSFKRIPLSPTNPRSGQSGP